MDYICLFVSASFTQPLLAMDSISLSLAFLCWVNRHILAHSSIVLLKMIHLLLTIKFTWETYKTNLLELPWLDPISGLGPKLGLCRQQMYSADHCQCPSLWEFWGESDQTGGLPMPNDYSHGTAVDVETGAHLWLTQAEGRCPERRAKTLTAVCMGKRQVGIVQFFSPCSWLFWRRGTLPSLLNCSMYHSVSKVQSEHVALLCPCDVVCATRGLHEGRVNATLCTFRYFSQGL